ncbi:MAG TPA: tetratricopeptide repeat protein [Candidatus Sulfotelmatobacter sp.]|jgi:Tfp pilus assembly protein PilF
MAAGKSLLGISLVLAFTLYSFAQSSAPGTPSGSSSSRPHGAHHVQVPDDDLPAQPAELTEAEADIDKQDYAAAEPLLRKVVEKDSNSYVGWFDLGFVENALGKTDDSIAAYRKSVAIKPDVFESNLNLGLQLAKSGQPGAEQFLRVATGLKPTSHAAEGQYRAWLALGHVLEKSKPDDALDAFQHAAALEPKESEPHLTAGVILEQENKASDAEKEYKAALAVEPGSSDAAIALANLYMHGHRFGDAEVYLRKLVKEQPGKAAAQIQLGRVLAAEGKNEEAIAPLQSGVKLSPNDLEAQLDLAEVYVSVGKNDLAEAAYRSLVTTHPTDAELHRKLGQTLLREKKFPEAQQEFITAVKIKPDLGEAYGDLAFAAGENHNYALALRALDARAKFLPEISITYFLRASANDHLRDYKTAAANYHLFLNTANGKYPDYEWKAEHRLIAIEPKK